MTMRNAARRIGWQGALLGATLALLAAGCGDDDSGDPSCGANLLPGDLVITEIMADPEGADDGKEWFEVYNATGQTIDLTGVTLVYSRADGTSPKDHVVTGGQIGPGEYMVFGSADEWAAPDYVDYPYAGAFSLTNSGGRLALECDDTLVDEVVYDLASSGQSRSLDGALVPDAMANDVFDDWCDSEDTEFEALNFGTPGAANEYCGGINPNGTCLDGGVERQLVAPQPGDVVISEIMPDPFAVGDTEGEWFEVYFAQAADLNGLELGTAPGDPDDVVGQADCIHVAAGSYVLFARNGDSGVNGGLPTPTWVYDGISLSNSGGTLIVSYAGVELDRLDYTAGMVSAGEAASLDSGMLDPVANNDATAWCDAVATYGAGDLGTPGAANPSCGVGPTDTCLDGGTPRAVNAPVAGDVVITEIMPNPAAVGDTDGEWFEVYFAQAADLNGLQLGNDVGTVDYTVSDPSCLTVAAGTYVLFAVDGDSGVNGGLPTVDVVYSGVSLTNSGGSLFVGHSGGVLDQVTYTSGMVAAGAAASLDPAYRNTTDNDNAAYWCDAVDPYGAGDLGTPGEANPSCNIVPPNSCIDPDTSSSRPIVQAQAGDVVITEIMANPNAVSDANGEWFEVYFAQAVDLNGLEITDSNSSATVSSGACIEVTAGSYVVFARNANPATNGGLTNVAATFGFDLVNGGESLSLGYGGTILDTITWTGSTAGVASALSFTQLDATANDNASNWCAATLVYGTGGDLGTPGSANATCP